MATQIAAQEQTGTFSLESSSASEKIIRKYHSKFRRELNVPLLLPYLNKYRLITADVHEELTLQTTAHASKVDRLVAELPKKGADFLERFIKCLRESLEEEPGSFHEEIADILEEELQTPEDVSNICSNAETETATKTNDNGDDHSTCKFETDNTSMSERVLKKCHFRLRNELNVLSLLPYLNKYHLITAEFHDELTLQTTHAAKVDRLVAELPRIGGDFLERFIKCLRESVEEEPATSHGQIADALEEELKFQKTHGCEYREINVASTYEGTSQNVPLLEHAGQPDEMDEELVPTTKLCGKTLCCYSITTLVIITVILAAVLITLSQVPRVSSTVNPHYVCGNSTVELLFDHMPWLSQIALAMEMCDGQLYQIQDQDCRTLPTLNTSYVDPNNRVYNIYMLAGSTIHFSVDPGASGQIWVLSGLETDLAYLNHPTSFDCQHPPPGACCFEAEDNPGEYTYYVTQPDFYYLQFHPQVIQGIDWYFNRTIFDIMAIADKYHSITTLTKNYYTIIFSFPYKKSCILLHIPPTCECDEMMAANAVRQDKYLIFPAIPTFVCTIVLIVVVGVCVYCHFRKRF